MPPPPIQVFLTTIASQPALRQRQEYVLRILQMKKAQFVSYDIASDEDAKKLWRRKAPLDKQQLPGILVGGDFPGTFQDFEEAVEFGELDQFLRLKEEWEPLEDDKALLRAVPVGVPGAHLPAQMNPEHVSPTPSPMKSKARPGEHDAGEKLGDAGLHGVNVTDDDLLKLVEELGLGEADAEDLVKGLSGESAPAHASEAVTEEERHGEVKAEEAKAEKTQTKEAKAEETANLETATESMKEVQETSGQMEKVDSVENQTDSRDKKDA